VALQAQDGEQGEEDGWGGREVIDVRAFTVGPVQENAYLVRTSGRAKSALMIDPGEEAQRLLEAARALEAEIEAILITHCHFDHIGAVAPLARATGAPVYCPEIEVGVLADIMKWTMPGFGPFESWRAEHTVKGGERLRLAGLDVEVLFTPGHSPGHVTYAISGGTLASDTASAPSPGLGVDGESGSPDAGAVLCSGDVLFQGSVGRVDLPGGDWATLERSIGSLMGRFERDTVVYPGHMGITTLGREWDTNPFLAELRAGAMAPVPLRSAGGEGPEGMQRARGS
jgi:glyoxylase-like metal-dependent hydrolase (beta-lactamase superfamily II)